MALTPRLLTRATPPPVVVLVDVLRATSTVTTLFALGARSVEVASGLLQAQALAAAGRVVCAEQWSGRQARGTGLPVSPSLLKGSAVSGMDVVMCTTNGTRALRHVASHASQVLLGCLLNATAVAEAAIDLAERLGTGISVVCAGRRLGAIPCLDDTYAAGEIVDRLSAAGARQGLDIVCSDAAGIARLVSDTSGPPWQALSSSATGAIMRRIDSEADIAFCARVDVTDVVPAVVRGGAEARSPVVLL